MLSLMRPCRSGSPGSTSSDPVEMTAMRGTRMHEDDPAAHSRQDGDLPGPDEGARREDHLTGDDVLGRTTDVGADLDRRRDADGLGAGVRALHRHDGVGPVRHRCAGHDAHGGPGPDRLGGAVAGRDVVDDRQLDRAQPRSPRRRRRRERRTRPSTSCRTTAAARGRRRRTRGRSRERRTAGSSSGARMVIPARIPLRYSSTLSTRATLDRPGGPGSVRERARPCSWPPRRPCRR